MDVGKRLKIIMRSEGFHNFCHNPFALIGFCIVLIFFLISVLGLVLPLRIHMILPT